MPPPADRQGEALPAATRDAGYPRHRVESAEPPLRPLPDPLGARQEVDGRDDGGRPRTGGVHVGGCEGGAGELINAAVRRCKSRFACRRGGEATGEEPPTDALWPPASDARRMTGTA